MGQQHSGGEVQMLAVLRDAAHAMLVINKCVRRRIRLIKRHLILDMDLLVCTGCAEGQLWTPSADSGTVASA